MEKTDHIISMKDIIRTYRTDTIETLAVNNISLQIRKGEFISVMGPSGCGKSTLLNLIGLLDTPNSGSYLFNGIETVALRNKAKSELRKHHIGFVFQSFNLIDELNVYENIELPLIYHKLSKKEIRERVQLVMANVGLEARKKHYPGQLSGGQQQRVAIARTLVVKPKVILADEPTGNLDSRNGEEVLGLLKTLNEQGTTIIMVTHSEHDAHFGDRILQMKDGSIITDRAI